MADENNSQSREAVALELTKIIANAEYNREDGKVQNRDYYLTLYRQCFKATNAHPLDSILKKD